MEIYRFTTKSIIDNETQERCRIRYNLEGDKLTVSGTWADGTPLQMELNPGEPLYDAARRAYEEKAAKREAAASEPREVPAKLWSGMKIQGAGYTIFADASIGRVTITFKGVPSPATREQVKAAGFYYSPNHKQWCRKMTEKAWRAAQLLHQQMAPA